MEQIAVLQRVVFLVKFIEETLSTCEELIYESADGFINVYYNFYIIIIIIVFHRFLGKRNSEK